MAQAEKPPGSQPSQKLSTVLHELYRGWREQPDAHKLAYEGYSVASTNGAVSEWWPARDGEAPAESCLGAVWLCFIPGRGLWHGARMPLRIEWNEGFPQTPPKLSFPAGFFHPHVYPSGKLCPGGKGGPSQFWGHDKGLCQLLLPEKYGPLGDMNPATLVKRMLCAVANSFLRVHNNRDAAQEPAWREFQVSYERGCKQTRLEAVKYGAPQDMELALLAPKHFDAPLPLAELAAPSRLAVDFSALLQDDTLADIELVCGADSLRAHRLVLAARSPVFAAQLSGPLARPGSAILEVSPEIEVDTLRRLLAWIYGEEFDCAASAAEAQALFAAADFYALPDLVRVCSRRLVAAMETGDVIASLLLAQRHNCAELKRAALIFLSTRAVEAMGSADWHSLTALPRPAEGAALVDEVLYAVARGKVLSHCELLGRGTKRGQPGEEEA